jgi:hypothetical protein
VLVEDPPATTSRVVEPRFLIQGGDGHDLSTAAPDVGRVMESIDRSLAHAASYENAL